jgi:hypothetical protein
MFDAQRLPIGSFTYSVTTDRVIAESFHRSDDIAFRAARRMGSPRIIKASIDY